MKRNKALLFATLGVVVVALGAAIVLWLRPPKGYLGKVERISFGNVPSGSVDLILIAREQSFFAANGLRVDTKEYSHGMATTDALLKGEVDMAWSSEFPLVRGAFAKDKFSIITVSSRFTNQYLFCRKYRGIATAVDLRGKRIGIPRNTIAEFYLGRFLELHGMATRDVTLLNVGEKESIDALFSGRADGAITWEPYSHQVRARLGDDAVVLPVQNNQPGYGVIICRNDWIRSYPKVVISFLRSLAQAEEYLICNPIGVKAIARKLNYDDVSMEATRLEVQFSLSLDQSLITAMEDEARWMIKNNLTSEKTVPIF
jgi:NitT/TauT family transport system substrate-binding protein